MVLGMIIVAAINWFSGFLIALICAAIVGIIGICIVHHLSKEEWRERLQSQQENMQMYKRLYESALTHQNELNSQLQELSLTAKDKETLEQQILSAQTQYNQMSLIYNDLMEKFKIKQQNYDDLEAKYIQKTDDIILLENKKDELKNTIFQNEDSISTQNTMLQELTSKLAALQETHRTVLKQEIAEANEDGDDYGWGMELNEAESRIIELVDDLTKMCPELSADLAAIKWKRIWLPKIQLLAGREALDGRSGIYKLTLKDNTKICYVGQAVNIKERWYTHIKKILGIESKGKERLYNNNYSPDDFYWGVIEFVDDKSRLNEKEKYWIDYYSCTEYGLNSKRGND